MLSKKGENLTIAVRHKKGNIYQGKKFISYLKQNHYIWLSNGF